MGKGRDGSDEREDTKETVGNSMGRALLGTSEMKRDNRVEGGEIVGNSLGRAPWGRTRGWTERKPWEIAWGEL